MILATKGGWLIVCDLVRETPKGKFVINRDDSSKTEYHVRNNDKRRKLFNDVNKATDWINEGKSCK